MNVKSTPSFSTTRKWTISLNVLLGVAAVLAIVLMVNYLVIRFLPLRWSFSRANQIELSPYTRRVLAGLTNPVKVTVYFDRDEALFDSVKALLKEYKFANDRIVIETVDYNRDPATASQIKAKYKLTQPSEKNLVIFDCNERRRVIAEGELSDLDVQPLLSGTSREVRRTHFKGEMVFTSAILTVSNPRPLKAYFLKDHGEHSPESDDKLMGYSKFSGLLRDNNIQLEPLSLLGSGEVPADCNLLIIAGPTDPLLQDELDKVDRYLRQGGRLLAMFKPVIYSPTRPSGLEKILESWGVEVGQNVVLDPKATVTRQDMIVGSFGSHPIVAPISQSHMYVVLPRSVQKAKGVSPAADAPQVEVLTRTSPEGRVLTDVRKNGEVYPSSSDVTGAIPLMVAVEKGSIRGVRADRGSTRMVVTGESMFLGNQMIDSAANRDFALHSLNWLLARNELLVDIGPRPIKEYKLTMSAAQLSAARWALLVGLPGVVFLAGLVVSVRRRK